MNETQIEEENEMEWQRLNLFYEKERARQKNE